MSEEIIVAARQLLTQSRDVKKLVGELDFSFHAVSTVQSAKSSAEVSRYSRATERNKLE